MVTSVATSGPAAGAVVAASLAGQCRLQHCAQRCLAVMNMCVVFTSQSLHAATFWSDQEEGYVSMRLLLVGRRVEECSLHAGILLLRCCICENVGECTCCRLHCCSSVYIV